MRILDRFAVTIPSFYDWAPREDAGMASPILNQEGEFDFAHSSIAWSERDRKLIHRTSWSALRTQWKGKAHHEQTAKMVGTKFGRYSRQDSHRIDPELYRPRLLVVSQEDLKGELHAD